MESMEEQLKGLISPDSSDADVAAESVDQQTVPFNHKYLESEFQGLDDEALTSLICKSWRIGGSRIIVHGVLQEIDAISGSFIKFTDIMTLRESDFIEYPFDVGVSLDLPRRGVFISQDYGKKLYKELGDRHLQCELVLSPKSERIKHENPFLLKVKVGTAEALEVIPKIDVGELIKGDDVGTLVTSAIYKKAMDTVSYRVKAAETKARLSFEQREKDYKNESQKLQGKEKATEAKLKALGLEVEQVEINKQLESDQLKQLERENKIQADALSVIKNEYKVAEEAMSIKLKKLKKYIEEKASFLKDFEFIDDDVFNEMVLSQDVINNTDDLLSFTDDLAGDYAQAVSYIQAHLLGKDILYPRHIIENFLTLIQSNDLIVLAGDSGSGKTNLVQSFASAVGGVSKIIPVKPNWTSSEDLLGYYNPLEKKYISTPFLEALIEAKHNPTVPYFICLDEMNLARVEYYFADFLSKLEGRGEQPEIYLYSDDESAHVLSELRNVIEIIKGAQNKYKKGNIVDFVKLLQDEEINNELKRAFGFSDKDSLIKYHSDIRRMLSGVISTPSSLTFPPNVRIIGAINIDETTHYLSPKILDRAHVMKFKSPLLSDWGAIQGEVEGYGLNDVKKSLHFEIEQLGHRESYPKFDKDDDFCALFVDINREILSPLGVEFGMRTIRQGLNYLDLFGKLNSNKDKAINNFLLHKVLPKFTFDGNKEVNGVKKSDLLYALKSRLDTDINYSNLSDEEFSSKKALQEIISQAEANDWIVNYWS